MTEVAAALIWRGKRFLACQRPAHKARGLLWEFVGGKLEPGETGEQALIRECKEELDIEVEPLDIFMEVTHEYPDMQVHLTLYNAVITAGEPKLLEHADLRWITPAEIDGLDFCPADEVILQKIKQTYGQPTVMEMIDSLRGPCTCGLTHDTSIRDIRIESGLKDRVGEILQENGFSKKLLLVADQNTLKAADGILESLQDFDIEFKMYDNLRLATMKEVEEIEALIQGREISVLSVGTGSLNDICRLACARHDKLLCLFATAPSMDGFASYSSPIVANGFKDSYPAKSPEVILGDTAILAAAPAELKSSGFGDMIAKYVALVDWQISSLLTDEVYCQQVADLTRRAVDTLMDMADRVTLPDEETAGQIFASLLMTGVGMSFMQNSRPASGAEHVVAHLIECKQLPQGILPDLHGEDVGVCTLEMLELYAKLAALPEIHTRKDNTDWAQVYNYYEAMADDVKKLNEPTTITDEVDPEAFREKWGEIREIIRSVPDAATCREAMKKAGCKLTYEDIKKPRELMDGCIKYSPYMRRRVTLLRLLPMIEESESL